MREAAKKGWRTSSLLISFRLRSNTFPPFLFLPPQNSFSCVSVELQEFSLREGNSLSLESIFSATSNRDAVGKWREQLRKVGRRKTFSWWSEWTNGGRHENFITWREERIGNPLQIFSISFFSFSFHSSFSSFIHSFALLCTYIWRGRKGGRKVNNIPVVRLFGCQNNEKLLTSISRDMCLCAETERKRIIMQSRECWDRK